MKQLQARWKAVVAFASTLIGSLISFYSVNQDLTLKQALAALVAAVLGGAAVHQVKNKKEK